MWLVARRSLFEGSEKIGGSGNGPKGQREIMMGSWVLMAVAYWLRLRVGYGGGHLFVGHVEKIERKTSLRLS